MPKGKKDLENEGRNAVELDVDRMINEGLAGGSIPAYYNSTQIEEARDLPTNGEPFPADKNIHSDEDS
ncbi:hypothetical protein [Pontibacillus litoralis]|uniref:Uncharacterized protein n=1 Tax=Pontibacillus litoralis JSM 072002 TaxID=1385512 RepID=A0A0A5FWV5_9BACI|nr:hypothetical protein [Pontibacillus litoralis]KGX85291.1 hypothetical protein N784_09630 [Pontibacillus litoralis JSM 072002]